ncbi:MAG TPA: IS1 family transposase [Solirubrobacteraceae bacterium]|nr:IS1 family transposase [Solirubrobacteraceae bacterium]
MRATARMAGCSFNTVSKLLLDVGAACTAFQDGALRNLSCAEIQCDEIWSFVGAKAKNVPDDRKGEFGLGDVWVWVAIDAESKLVPSWLLGERKTADCVAFLDDLRERLRYRIQLSTDAHASYKGAVGLVFAGDVDWAQVVKEYKSTNVAPGRYSPPACTGMHIKPQLGSPDLAKVSTSYIERQNLTMRMNMRRFTRLTNAFSKKLENHAASVALHFMAYNFVRPHKTLANPYPRTPAMAAGVADHVWSLSEVVTLTG